MTCCYCRTTFYHASMGGPAEDCDCGKNATQRDVADDKAERFDGTPHDDYDVDEVDRDV